MCVNIKHGWSCKKNIVEYGAKFDTSQQQKVGKLHKQVYNTWELFVLDETKVTLSVHRNSLELSKSYQRRNFQIFLMYVCIFAISHGDTLPILSHIKDTCPENMMQYKGQ